MLNAHNEKYLLCKRYGLLVSKLVAFPHLLIVFESTVSAPPLLSAMLSSAYAVWLKSSIALIETFQPNNVR